MIDPRVASGLRDIPPAVMIPRERMLAQFRGVFASFGFVPIETPHIERMEVLTGKGAGSDEVLRQIFEVTNKGGTPGELALRFDLTVPLARFIAKHVEELGTPFKRYAIGSVFRGERPAKGRFREFVQCDFDTVGTESVVSDAEIAHVIFQALSSAGVPDFTITLNDRRILGGLLIALNLSDKEQSVLRILDKIDKIGTGGVMKELEKAGVAQDTSQQIMDFVQGGKGKSLDVFAAIEQMADQLQYGEKVASEAGHTIKAGISTLRSIVDLLRAAGVPSRRLAFNLGLARGLDYYTGIVFETTVDGWERFGSVASGGRYDNLANLFTSRTLPGVGASIGLDRLLALMDEAGWLKGSATMAPVLVANFPGGDVSAIVKLATRLRAAGIGAEVFPDAIQIGKQMGYGSSRGHRFAVIVGPDEMSGQVFNLRDLSTRRETKAIPWSELETAVAGALKGVAS